MSARFREDRMKRVRVVCSGLMICFGCAASFHAQESAATPDVRPLVLTEAIPLENIKGRFDHFGTSGRKLFVSALGNNTVEVIDFRGDVDNLRYDAANKRVYVGYGDEETAAIGAVDATTNKRTDEEYKLGAHPESFQLESAGPNIYVNLPDLKQIAVINRSTHAIARWPLTLEHNFPMALDEADHRLFVGTHEPARMAVFDTQSGQMITALPSVQDADDLYYDAGRKRIYMAGGEGFIYTFQQSDPSHYQLLGKMPTTLGARTAGYFGKGKKGFERFFLAVPARSDHGAEIWIYTVQD